MREWVLALLKIKPQPNPAESSSAFFMLGNIFPNIFDVVFDTIK